MVTNFLVILCAFTLFGCAYRVDQKQVEEIAVKSYSELGAMYYMGKKGDDCYLYHDRFFAMDHKYVVNPEGIKFYPDKAYSNKPDDWLPFNVYISSAGIPRVWIQDPSSDQN